jgi:hypothetical protein
MNKIEIQFDFFGTWHIGLQINNEFVKYFSNEHLYYETDISNLKIDLTFLGKDHSKDSENFVKINKIYYNDLMLDSLIEQSTFNTDNLDYKTIKNCNYINLNGIWQLKITNDIVSKELEKYLQ